MINYYIKFKKWRQSCIEKSKQKVYREGWCWAMHRYFIEEASIDSLKATVACAEDFGDKGEFDYGVERAIDLIEKIRGQNVQHR
jgi:hypothetical protein